MIRYFLKSLLFHLRHSAGLYLLSIFGVSLGVASVVAIQIINFNALGAFEATVEVVTGAADLTIEGHSPLISDSIIVEVLSQPGVAGCWPILEAKMTVDQDPPFVLNIVGTDLYAGRPLARSVAAEELSVAAIQPGWIAVSRKLAQEFDLSPGDILPASTGSGRITLQVGSVIDLANRYPQAGSRLAFMDIAQLQDALQASGNISRLGVRTDPSINLEHLSRNLSETLGPGYRVLASDRQNGGAADLLGAFRLNLTALSLISLFVGGFLIYSSTQASLLRRRTEFGLLRSIGATRRQLLGLILGEALILGLAGVAAGLPLGYAAAQYNLETVNSTLTNIYLLQRIETLVLPGWIYLLAAAIGAGSALLGTLLPALDVSRRDTRRLLSAFTLQFHLSRFSKPLGIAGLLLLAVAFAWHQIFGHHWKPAGFVLAIALLIALPLVTPQAILILCKQLPLRNFGFTYSLKSLAVRLQTTALAVAALAVAVSMLTGITIMIGSFRETVRVWIEKTLIADVYVTSRATAGIGTSGPLPSDLVEALAQFPGVESAERLRNLTVYSKDRRILLSGVDFQAKSHRLEFPLLEGDPVAAFATLKKTPSILISEPLSRKTGISKGDRLPLKTPAGPVQLAVTGVYYDYKSESGAAMMDLTQMNRIFGNPQVNSVALFLKKGIDAEQVADRILTNFSEIPIHANSNQAVRQNVFRIFDQTFAVVRILQLMSLLIAVCGITLALLILARQRISELALYRSLGALRGQIFRIFVSEGTAMAGLGLILGSAGGLLLAWILTYVINRAYFGWTIQFFVPWLTLSTEALIIVAGSALASLYPALRAARTPATELSRDVV